MVDSFPLKLALGNQFCNRTEEKAFLIHNIAQCRHTVLIAPRRYGKSSLVFNVVAELNTAVASIDLFLAHDDLAVTKRILVGISQAVSHLMPANQKLLAKLQKLFGKFRVSLGINGFSIDASIETSGLDPVDQIFSALQGVDALAKEQDKPIIVFIDEFQDITEAKSAKSIQGAIRHIAQSTKHITFIFSGSNRRLLLELFDDKSKPLYMLCDMLHVERMSSESYYPHLQALAKAKWNQELSPLVFEKIMTLTELHPYYVNMLCHEVWKNKHLPTMEAIFAAWQKCYEAQEDRLITELDKLTAKQKDILKALAVQPTIEPTGHSFVRVSQMPASSISQTIRALLDKDMVYRIKKIDEAVPALEKNQIRVLDPLLAYALKKYA